MYRWMTADRDYGVVAYVGGNRKDAGVEHVGCNEGDVGCNELRCESKSRNLLEE